MARFLLRWIVLALALVATSTIMTALGLPLVVDPLKEPSDYLRLMAGVAILSMLHATLGRVLKLLTLPLNCLTLGFFSLVVNAAVLMIAASFNFGYQIKASGFEAFVTAFVGSLLISVVSGVLGTFIPDKHDKDE